MWQMTLSYNSLTSMLSKSDGWLSFKKPTHEVQFDFEDPCRPLCMHHHYYHPWHEDAWRLEGPVKRDPRFRWLTCYFCIIPVTTPAMRWFRSFRGFWKLNLFVKMCVELKVCCKEHVSLWLTCIQVSGLSSLVCWPVAEWESRTFGAF